MMSALSHFVASTHMFSYLLPANLYGTDQLRTCMFNETDGSYLEQAKV